LLLVSQIKFLAGAIGPAKFRIRCQCLFGPHLYETFWWRTRHKVADSFICRLPVLNFIDFQILYGAARQQVWGNVKRSMAWRRIRYLMAASNGRCAPRPAPLEP